VVMRGGFKVLRLDTREKRGGRRGAHLRTLLLSLGAGQGKIEDEGQGIFYRLLDVLLPIEPL